MATVQYIDPFGQNKTGYAIDGKTYVDEAGTMRVPVGSQVLAGGQMWQMTDNGGVLMTPPAKTSPVNFIDEITNSKLEAQKQGLLSAYNQNVSSVGAQRAAIPQIYQDARNSTAGQSEVQRANFNEYAASTGLNSGAGGQAQLAFSNQLAGNIATLDRSEAKAKTDLDQKLAEIFTTYQSQIAQAQANADYDKMSMLYTQYQNDQANARADAQRQDEIGYARAVDRANSSGIYDGLAAYGWKPEEIASANNQWKIANTPKQVYSGGSGSGKKTGNTAMFEDIKASGIDPTSYFIMQGYKPNEAMILKQGYDAWNAGSADPIRTQIANEASTLVGQGVNAQGLIIRLSPYVERGQISLQDLKDLIAAATA